MTVRPAQSDPGFATVRRLVRAVLTFVLIGLAAAI